MPSAFRSVSYFSPNCEKCGALSKFDRDVALHAEEIDNMAIDAVLPPELLAEELPSLKVFP